MKKIFLLLTIIFSQTQACLTNSENLTSQVIAENQDPAKDKKPQTWREYCNKKVASAKNGLNNGYMWVKNNPGKVLLATIIMLIIVADYHRFKNRQINRINNNNANNQNDTTSAFLIEKTQNDVNSEGDNPFATDDEKTDPVFMRLINEARGVFENINKTGKDESEA